MGQIATLQASIAAAIDARIKQAKTGRAVAA